MGDIAVVADRRVLLVRYEDVSHYDGQRGWFLPDDYLADGEHPDAAARRILREQAGLQLEPALAEIESLANGTWHLIFHYRTAAAAPDPVRPGWKQRGSHRPGGTRRSRARCRPHP